MFSDGSKHQEKFSLAFVSGVVKQYRSSMLTAMVKIDVEIKDWLCALLCYLLHVDVDISLHGIRWSGFVIAPKLRLICLLKGPRYLESF